MNTLQRRLSKLEGGLNGEDLVVMLQSFDGGGEYDQVESLYGDVASRQPDEAEVDFLSRAREQLLEAIKQAHGPQPCYTLQAVRTHSALIDTTLSLSAPRTVEGAIMWPLPRTALDE